MLEGRAEVQRVYEGMASQGIVEHVGKIALAGSGPRGTRRRTTVRKLRS